MSALPEPIPTTFTTSDGYLLNGIHYPAIGEAVGDIVIAAATGVPQGFYRRFAQACQARGYNALTFDYRGIGKSLYGSLKGFHATFTLWGEVDMTAAVEHIKHPSRPLFLVGHSFGGQILGLTPSHPDIRAAWVCGAGAGWTGWMPVPERWRVWAMWSVFLPLAVAATGRLPWSRAGMGEDLPKGVYKQWKRWCSMPHYFFDDPEMAGIEKKFAQVKTPIRALNSTDDLWAPPRSRDAFVQYYTHAPLERIDIDPAKYSGAIGHMGYFRADTSALWDDAFNWFDQLR